MSTKINDVIHRLKNLQQFQISLEVPEDFEFHGPVPFDMRIADGQASVIVWALTEEEARQRAMEYFNPYDGTT
jgi:hypothetical protein